MYPRDRMKPILSVLMLVISITSHAQTPLQFDQRAKEVAAKTPLTHRAVHQLRNQAQWVRYDVTMSNVKWDVKKTDSLLNPVVAVVTADLTFTSTPPQPSAELAEAAEARPPLDVDRIELNYAPSDTGWTWTSGRTALAVLKRWNPITPGERNLPKDPEMRWLAEQFLPQPN